MSIWHWNRIPSSPPPEHQVTLGEGQTPVVTAKNVVPAAGGRQLWLKLETSNPTGSYKDRFAASAISHMQAAGQSRCLATSSGNTGSALAAYCAATKTACKIAIVESAPAGKLMQMQAYGAQLFRVRGFGLDPEITQQTFATLLRCADVPDAALQISAYCFSPLGMLGVQTISYELVEQIPSIEHVFVPAGGGGLTLAVARGFQELIQNGRIAQSPRIHCVQPQGNATIAAALREGKKEARNVVCTSRISGLQVPTVLDGNEVIAACQASGGTGFLVTDDEVYSAQQRLAQEEGIFCEPAAATALAGALQAFQDGTVRLGENTVCLVTGSGFKDMASIEAMIANSVCPLIDHHHVASMMAAV